MVGPAGFGVPQVDTFDGAVIAGQVHEAGASTVGNGVVDGQLFGGAIAEAHHDAFKVDGAAADVQLNGAERPTWMLS